MRVLIIFMASLLMACTHNNSNLPPIEIDLIVERHEPEFRECMAQNVQLVWSGINPDFIAESCWQKVLSESGY